MYRHRLLIDATPLRLCHNRRSSQHKVFNGVAQRGKCSIGYFFGFKLHLVINDQGELFGIRLAPGNVDDRVPVRELCKDLFGKLIGDKGYISAALAADLLAGDVELVTKAKKNMKPRLLKLWDRLLLRKRALIECVNDHGERYRLAKNVCQIEHSRHRSGTGFMVNLLGALVAYSFLPKKPSLNQDEFRALQAALA